MIFFKYTKLFVISLFYLVVFVQAYSVSQIGDIKIEKTADIWVCDMIECPPDTERCFVSKSNEEEPSVLKRVNICFSKDNGILAEKNTSTAINPNLQIRQYINSYRSGSISSTSGGSTANFDPTAFNANLEEKMKRLQTRLENVHHDIENKIKTQMNNWANMFGYSF